MTLIDKAEALAPCPFCGGEARYQADHTTECRDSVWCGACDFGMFDPDEQGSVVAAWNRRAALPARGVEVKPLVDAVEALNAACDAMWNDHHRLEDNPSRFGQEMRLKEKHVKAITEAQQRLPAILAALAPTDAAQARSRCPYGATSDDCCGGYCNMDDDQKGGDAHAGHGVQAPDATSPGVTAGADAAQAGPAWLSNCVICGRIVDTREKAEGGDGHGCEYPEGWTCSSECAEKLHPDPEWMKEGLAAQAREALASAAPERIAIRYDGYEQSIQWDAGWYLPDGREEEVTYRREDDPAQAREAALREAAEIALRHRSKVQINEELWHEGQDWAAERIAEAILALIGGSK